MRSLFLVAALAASTAACGGAPVPASRAAGEPQAIAFEVAVASADPWILEVRAAFEGGVTRVAIAFPAAVHDLVVEEAGRERSPEAHGRAWNVGCAATCTVRYKLNLS